MRARLALLICIATSSPLFAQPDPVKKTVPEPAPPEAVILDLRAAYSKSTAEEVSVKFRPPTGSGATERSDTFQVRIDPGEPGSPNRPRAMLLELGALRVYLSAGKLTAINSSVADKVYTRTYVEPLTVARLAELLPPLPIPQLALASDTDLLLRAPLSQLSDITWEPGVWGDLSRPPTISMKGSGSSGTIELQVGVQSRRLIKVSATIRRAGSEGTFDLSCRPIDPGDPTKWTIPIEGRQPVNGLVDLKASAKPLATLEIGQPVPNISLSRSDLTGWHLHEALESAKPALFTLILLRNSADPSKTQATLRDAIVGLSALRAIRAADAPSPNSAAAIALELADFTQDRWKELRRSWSPPADSTPFPADDLMWASGAAQSIDRFSPTAVALIAVIRPDRSLAAIINLDGRSDKPDEVAAELRRAILSPP